jgi:NADPH:quinone reductase
MRAVLITQPGGVEVLQAADVANPVLRPNHVLVRVHATAVNRADLMQRRGNYPAPAGWPADIPGLEYAGVVEHCGEGVTRWRGGERVMGIVGGGSYAEYVAVHEAEAIPIPDALTFEQAAAVPEAFLTAFDALRVRLQLPLANNGETVLIHAVASGVGTAAMQLAHAMDLRVIGTARSGWKLDRLRDVAPAMFVDTTQQDFVEVATRQGGVQYVVDLVGGDYLGRNISAIAPLGRIVVVGLVAGSASMLDMRMLLNKRLTIVGTVLRARSLAEKIEIAQIFEREALPWLASGQIVPVVDRVFDMKDVQEAHTLAEKNGNVGKLVLRGLP